MKEADVLIVVKGYLEVCGFTMYRRNTGAEEKSYTSKRTGITKNRFVRYSEKGACDLWGVQRHTGRHLEVEVKASDWTPPKPGTRDWPHWFDQVNWMAEMRLCHCIVFWCRSREECHEKLIAAMGGFAA